MSAEEMKAEFVSRAKLSEQAERYDDMAEYMRKVTESGLGKFLFDYSECQKCRPLRRHRDSKLLSRKRQRRTSQSDISLILLKL